ncbi:MAG: HipA N-terminal domain-containing protein [Gemmatimonadota bacterium]|nr:HipA N-terminal domain-containing protein [Gemmatimonadota bacterium]MDE2872097.1 HipA N-terminal domain-containing protein [Gemmatimonadota bacterium]
MTGRLIAVANGRLLGEITRDTGGRLSFTYDAAWRSDDTAYPPSLSMPLTASGHGRDRIEPWLWGLLPDNENVLARWARRFQVSGRSVFSLLSATGEDCPGAVQFARPERAGRLLGSGPREVVWLTTANVEARLRTLRNDNS